MILKRNNDRYRYTDKEVKELMQDVIFAYTDLYKKFTEDADFKRQYLDFGFDKICKQQATWDW